MSTSGLLIRRSGHLFKHSGKVWRTDDHAPLCCPRGIFKTNMKIWGLLRHYHTTETPLSNCSSRHGYYDARSIYGEDLNNYCMIVCPEALEDLTTFLTAPAYFYELTLPNGEVITINITPNMLLVRLMQLSDRVRLVAPGVVLKVPVGWVNAALPVNGHWGVTVECDTCQPPPPPAVPEPRLVCPTPGFDGLYMGGKRELFVYAQSNVPQAQWPALKVANAEIRGGVSMVLDILGLVLTEQQWQNLSVAMLVAYSQGHPAECRWHISSVLYNDHGNHFDLLDPDSLGVRCGAHVDYDTLLFPGVTPSGEPQIDSGPAPILLQTPKLFYHTWTEAYEYHVNGCEPCDLGLCGDVSSGPWAHTSLLAQLGSIYDL